MIFIFLAFIEFAKNNFDFKHSKQEM